MNVRGANAIVPGQRAVCACEDEIGTAGKTGTPGSHLTLPNKSPRRPRCRCSSEVPAMLLRGTDGEQAQVLAVGHKPLNLWPPQLR